jgi:hypothetical protein
MRIKPIIAAALLALLLSAGANAQGVLEGFGQKIDALGGKVQAI